MPYGLIFTVLFLAGFGWKVLATPAWQDAIGQAATDVVRPLVIPLVELINKPSFVYVLSTVILVAAIVVCVAYWLRLVRPQIRRLRAFSRTVQWLRAPASLDDAPRTGEALRALGEAMRAQSLFPTAWAAFQAQAAREEGLPGTPFSAFVAADPTAGERRGLMAALPSYFTSVGLIFTFVGLVVALYFAARGFRSGNVEEARASILQLLNASSFKFLTSVAALVAALLVSLVHRFGLSLVRREQERAVAAVEGYLSAWREVQGTLTPRPGLAQVTERLERLILAVEALTGRLDAAAPRAAPAPAEALRGAQ
ncbi:MAG TPA: hypothetical protein VIL65_08690 [Beijerinckiaceae bacterium]